jgi:hypothetical protein
MNIERTLFSNKESDTFTVKIPDKAHEATKYLEQSFEWSGVKDNLIYLRKRK